MKTRLTVVCVSVALLSGCVSSVPDRSELTLTPAKVAQTMEIGKTTQIDVVKALGTPNMLLKDGATKEVWTYDQMHVERTKTGYTLGAGLLFLDPSGTVTSAGGTRGEYESKKDVSFVKTMTLIVEFDKNSIVSDFKMLSTTF